ncbi:inositol 1,4,5-triphosphate receptor associated 2-like [Hetaerina americana]|uniref:inositol 1,4,5-triphosphate receptor associated 2-like n=1 Tax=Hetaerina americana TaxID=62018 RepID=UPI003A7F4523
MIVMSQYEEGSTLDYIFKQCDKKGLGHVATSQLISFLTNLVDGTELGKELVNELHALLDPTGEDIEINQVQFRNALEEWEVRITGQRPADNIEILPSVSDREECSSFEEKDGNVWKSPLNIHNSSVDSAEAEDQLRHTNNELTLQKKWLEEQNTKLMAILKNSEDSNAALQISYDSLKKENENLKLSIEGMKSLRAENEELKDLLSSTEKRYSELKVHTKRLEQEANDYQNVVDELESEKTGLKNDLESCLSSENEYIGVIESQSQELKCLSEEKRVNEEKLNSEKVKCEELQSNVDSLMSALKICEEEKEELEEKMAKLQEKCWTSSPRRSLEFSSNLKLSPKYVAGLCSYEEVRDECKTLYKDLFSESPAVSSEEKVTSIESELKSQKKKKANLF